MKILITNDDGIDAPGIRALFASVTLAMQRDRPGQPYQVVVVAPDRCRSECGHSIETRHPLTIKTIQPDWHALTGTPVDCVRVAIQAMQVRPNVVLSGINAGANLGVNLMVSGTFAAAREASLLGVPAMAVSHYRRPDVPRTWDHTPAWIAETMAEFFAAACECERSISQPPLWNVNLPAVDPDATRVPPRIECLVDRCPITRTGSIAGWENGSAAGARQPKATVRFDIDFHGRPREPGRDVEHCFGGRMTISKLDRQIGW
ncbi:5'/3'-nucleotidase SurE [Stieleria sp. TO1_6]|uniref:5'/3'-nucleotidase SurE n=1 Tax=Stieleria tagensis TaxID=2956795 RepID=UPI00209B9CC8|nr:5'/3'-nucleotidase SurE [Stieleria tagensis]MCO8122677.1 5'/3'-nucleotidase SurE [Stieleria tagensis]